MALQALCLVLATALVAGEEAAWPWSMWRSSLIQVDGPPKSTTPLPEFYHSSDAIVSELQDLQKGCEGLKVQSHQDEADGSPIIHYALYQHPDVKEASTRTMVVAGEHARELIGSETALTFLKELCAETRDEVVAARKDVSYMVVVNANPASRKEVETGDFCLRANPAGTDLNRNWDVNWGTVNDNPGESNPGPKSFSEPESRSLRDLMTTFMPHLYLNLHSGNLGMYLPNKYIEMKDKTAPVTARLVELDEEVCKCPLGIANELVGYRTCGSSLDYSFEKIGTRFSMAVEVFVDRERMPALRKQWDGQKEEFKKFAGPANFLEGGVGHEAGFPFKDAPKFIESKLVKTMTDQDACLSYFNPTDEQQFHETTAQWSHAIFAMVLKTKDLPDKPGQAEKRSKLIIKQGMEGANMNSIAFNLKRASLLNPATADNIGRVTNEKKANIFKALAWCTFAVALVVVGQKMGLGRMWLNRKGAGEGRPLVAGEQAMVGSIQVSD